MHFRVPIFSVFLLLPELCPTVVLSFFIKTLEPVDHFGIERNFLGAKPLKLQVTCIC